MAARASDPNPQKASRTNSRRERVTRTWARGSLDIKKAVEIEQSQCEFFERLFPQEGHGQRFFLGSRRAPDGQPVGALGDPHRVGAALFLQTRREGPGKFVREFSVEQLQRLRCMRARL